MNFFYIASGGLGLSKCGVGHIFQPAYFRQVAFSVGDQAWLKFKAEVGILECVVIKKIRIFPQPYLGQGWGTVIYIDTFNAVYNEWDLLYYRDALTLANNYINQQLLAAQQAECLR